MGVKERKARQKVEMKSLILEAAHDLFLNKGFEQVSIRNIADEIEYSPATIYLYFKDKNEIFLALHDRSFKVFNGYVADIFKIKDPFKRLTALGERYIDFAIEHPQYYEMMFIIKAPMECDINKEEWPEGQVALDAVEFLMADCKKAGYFKGQDVKVLAFVAWSHMHGICSLVLRDRLKIYEESQRDGIRTKSFKVFMKMLQQL
jgi:AcrR family transcriptional regulator